MNQKKKQNLLNNVDALILCGGLGTRLRPVVSDRPKVMARVGDKPFLEIIVLDLLRQGFQRIIFCTGYMGDKIENHFKNHPHSKNAKFEFSFEEKPLGTGGAVKNALKFINSENFLVMNGDSFPNVNLEDFYSSHLKKQSLLSIALVKKKDGEDYGSVILAKNDEIISFAEKNKSTSDSFVNAGCYLMNKTIENHLPAEDSFSLEYDVFPKLAAASHGFVFDGKFLDIGTPERFMSAESFFS